MPKTNGKGHEMFVTIACGSSILYYQYSQRCASRCARYLFETIRPLFKHVRIKLCLRHHQRPQPLSRERIHVLHRLLDGLASRLKMHVQSFQFASVDRRTMVLLTIPLTSIVHDRAAGLRFTRRAFTVCVHLRASVSPHQEQRKQARALRSRPRVPVQQTLLISTCPTRATI